MTFELKREHVAEMLKGNKNIDAWYDAMLKILPKYNINTPSRIAGFVAQCAHESINFTTLEENLNYRAETLNKIFPKYFGKNRNAVEYAMKPEKIANLVYASRMGNGDGASGDGYKFRGRGIIQLTGRENYTNFGKSIGKTPDEVISYLGTIDGAIESACWYWNLRNINEACDTNDITKMTKLINGGINGLTDRKEKYEQYLKILNASVAVVETKVVTQISAILKRGSRGQLVADLQKALGLIADGIFGIGTEMTLKSWQSSNGLIADGIAGPKTLAKLLK